MEAGPIDNNTAPVRLVGGACESRGQMATGASAHASPVAASPQIRVSFPRKQKWPRVGGTTGAVALRGLIAARREVYGSRSRQFSGAPNQGASK